MSPVTAWRTLTSGDVEFKLQRAIHLAANLRPVEVELFPVLT